MDDDVQQSLQEISAEEEMALRVRLNAAEARKSAALERKKTLDKELKQFQQQEDAGAINAIRNQLMS